MFLILALNSMRYSTKLFLDPQDISLIQIKNILAPDAADWKNRKLDITKSITMRKRACCS
jgi:hypothetical protein